MKHFSLGHAALWLLCIFAVACSGLLAPTEDPLSSIGKIRIGVDATLPPFEFDSSNPDEAIGFDVDLINAIADRTGLDIELIKVGYNQVLPFVSRCDLAAGISAIPVMDSTGQPVVFSDPYYSTGQVVVVKQGNITISGRETLAGMTVGTQAGTLSEMELKQIPGIEVQLFDSYYLAVQELAGGYIDAVIADRPRAQSFVEVKRNDLKIVGDEFGQVEYAIATCPSQSGLLTQINDGLAQLKTDGTLDKLVKKWKLDAAP